MFQNSFMSLWFNGKKIVRSKKFLQEMNKIIPYDKFMWILKEKYEKNNTRWRPQYQLLLMLKIHLLQQFYTLWDEAVEDAIYDRLSFQEFLWIDTLSSNVPDATTIENFRHLLEKYKLQELFFEEVLKMLEVNKILLKRWTVVDATIVKASSSTKNKEQKRDKEMWSTLKNNNYHFWWKIHIWVDVESGLVHSTTITKASVNDKKERDNLLHWEEKAIFWDKAYGDKKTKKECRKNWVYYWISDKWSRYVKISSNQKKKNKKKSIVRAKVEHVFRVVKCQFWFRKFRYKWIEKNALNVKMKLALANLYLARKRLILLTW